MSDEQKQHLAEANALIYRFQNDSAILLLQPLLEQLIQQDIVDSPFGLEVLLAKGRALRQDNQDTEAVTILNKVKEASRQSANWDTYASTCLELAYLYTENYRSGEAFRHLNIARSTIVKHKLEALYPILYNRLAFWHKSRNHIDSATVFAQQAFPLLEQESRPDLRAAYLTLLAYIQEEIDFRLAIAYYQKAARIYEQIGDYVNLSNVWYRINRLYEQQDLYAKAKAYNDSTIMACYWAIAAGQERIATLHEAYLRRGKLYTSLGQLDSALYYTKKGFSQEVKFIHQQENARVAEIDEQYKDEQKVQQLQLKEQQLRWSKQRATIMLILMLVGLVFALLLFRSYARLRKANQVVIKQSNLIAETNSKLARSLEQQIVLQGEMHHRVKNNLQVIISLLEMQKEDIAEARTRDSLDAMSSRIYSMAAIHDELYQQDGEHVVDFLAYAKKLCHHLGALAVESEPRFVLSIPRQRFNLETLMPLGIILNELLTNSVKYASRKGQELIINIRMRPQAEGFLLSYKDNGPGFSGGQLEDREGGLGAYLIRSMSRQLMGHLKTSNDGGAIYHIYFQEKNAS